MAGLGGVIGTVLGWLGYQVGQRTDVADAAGSLHAKLGNVINTIFPWHLKTATYSHGGITSLAANTVQEVLRIDGERVVLGGQIVGCSSADYMILELLVDEVLIFRRALNVLSGASGASAPYRTVTTDDTEVQWVIPIPHGLHFSTSLVVRLEHTSLGGDTTDVGVAVWHVPA